MDFKLRSDINILFNFPKTYGQAVNHDFLFYLARLGKSPMKACKHDFLRMRFEIIIGVPFTYAAA